MTVKLEQIVRVKFYLESLQTEKVIRKIVDSHAPPLHNKNIASSHKLIKTDATQKHV